MKSGKSCTMNLSSKSSSNINTKDFNVKDSKRMKLDKRPPKEGGTHWRAGEEVTPDILEDMGVGMLDDESYDPPTPNVLNCGGKAFSPPAVSRLNGDVPNASSKNKESDVIGSQVSDDFFLFKRKKPSGSIGEDGFSKLSDEIILQIFWWLPKQTLTRCARVCKRWRQIAYDEGLWTRLDLGNRCLSPGHLGQVLKMGVVILRLASAEIPSPVFLDRFSRVPSDFTSKLQFLDLSMAVISAKGLSSVLRTCKYLKKLSLEHCTLGYDSCASIGQNVHLEVLNMSACYGVTKQGISSIVTGCKKLRSWNLAWTNLDESSLDLLCDNLPKSATHLNLSGCRKTISDIHVQNLIKTCPDLMELDLSDCTNLSASTVESIVQGLCKIEYIALSRCYNIPPTSYLLLSNMETLMYLEVFGLMGEQSLRSLQHNLPGIEINKFRFSSIARPTVGIRRTSIWGLRVRD